MALQAQLDVIRSLSDLNDAMRTGMRLVKVDLNSTHLDDDDIAELYVAAQLIVELDLGITRLSDGACRHLARLLEEPDCALEILNLGANRIGDKGVAVLAPAIANNTSLKQLSLRYNRITGKGVTALSRHLHRRQPLEELSLAGNGIEGSEPFNRACSITKALVYVSNCLDTIEIRSPVLERLDVSRCGIRKVRVTENVPLRVLNLADNKLVSFPTIASLETLSLENNFLTYERLLLLVHKYAGLYVLNVSGNLFNAEQGRNLIDKWRRSASRRSTLEIIPLDKLKDLDPQTLKRTFERLQEVAGLLPPDPLTPKKTPIPKRSMSAVGLTPSRSNLSISSTQALSPHMSRLSLEEHIMSDVMTESVAMTISSSDEDDEIGRADDFSPLGLTVDIQQLPQDEEEEVISTPNPRTIDGTSTFKPSAAIHHPEPTPDEDEFPLETEPNTLLERHFGDESQPEDALIPKLESPKEDKTAHQHQRSEPLPQIAPQPIPIQPPNIPHKPAPTPTSKIDLTVLKRMENIEHEMMRLRSLLKQRESEYENLKSSVSSSTETIQLRSPEPPRRGLVSPSPAPVAGLSLTAVVQPERQVDRILILDDDEIESAPVIEEPQPLTPPTRGLPLVPMTMNEDSKETEDPAPEPEPNPESAASPINPEDDRESEAQSPQELMTIESQTQTVSTDIRLEPDTPIVESKSEIETKDQSVRLLPEPQQDSSDNTADSLPLPKVEIVLEPSDEIDDHQLSPSPCAESPGTFTPITTPMVSSQIPRHPLARVHMTIDEPEIVPASPAADIAVAEALELPEEDENELVGSPKAELDMSRTTCVIEQPEDFEIRASDIKLKQCGQPEVHSYFVKTPIANQKHKKKIVFELMVTPLKNKLGDESVKCTILLYHVVNEGLFSRGERGTLWNEYELSHKSTVTLHPSEIKYWILKNWSLERNKWDKPITISLKEHRTEVHAIVSDCIQKMKEYHKLGRVVSEKKITPRKSPLMSPKRTTLSRSISLPNFQASESDAKESRESPTYPSSPNVISPLSISEGPQTHERQQSATLDMFIATSVTTEMTVETDVERSDEEEIDLEIIPETPHTDTTPIIAGCTLPAVTESASSTGEQKSELLLSEREEIPTKEIENPKQRSGIAAITMTPATVVTTSLPDPMPPAPQNRVYIAKHSYKGPDRHYMSFESGDWLEIVGERSGWLICLDPADSKRKYVPPAYVQEKIS